MTETDWANYLVLWAPEMTYQDSLSYYRIDFEYDFAEYGGEHNSPIAALKAARYANPGLRIEAVYVLRNLELDMFHWEKIEGVL